MRLGVLSDEISQDLDSALAVCEELGLREVELRTVAGRNVVEHDRPSLGAVRDALAAGGFSCPVIASPFLKTPPHQVDWGALERSFEVAHLVGAGMVRTFSWLRDGADAETERRLVEVLASAIERTAAAGLRLVLENEHACTVATGAEAARVLDALPGEAFGLIWDPGNEARMGSTPYPDGYARVRHRVAHVHVKDADPDGRWVRVGAGAIDYRGQLAALAADGYAGCLSVETHYILGPDGGEAATRECVAGLRERAAEAEVMVA
jgi:sugar phosphate isomerase/epimerase